MEDSQIYEAELAYGQMYEDADFMSELQGKICAEVEQFLWTNSESTHDLKAAEKIMEHYTGHGWDVSEILFELLDDPNHNNQQIYGFIEDLMNNQMNNDSALELSAILAEHITQDEGSIISHHKELANDDYDGPDSDEDY